MALPGQQVWTGPGGVQVSNLCFGSNMSQDFAAQTTRNNATIQAKIKAMNMQLMRCAIPANSTNAYLDETMNACAAMGCVPLVILIHDNLTWNQQLVTYLGSRCNLYEFGNEPDLFPITGAQYLSFWNSHIPSLRAINTNAAFIGPVLGVFANLTSFVTPWLQGCLSAGTLPDAISYHVYPCTGGISQSACAPKASNFSNCFGQVDALVKSILGHALPQALTEWNIDASAPPAAYTQDPAFCGTWTNTALNNIAQAGFAIACQWDAGGGAAGGEDDLVSTQSPFNAQVQYQPMATVISQYTPGGTGGGGGTPHACVVALENHSYNNANAKYVLGNPNFPHINAFLNKYGYCTKFYGVSHPSLPNYISFACGSTKGITNDTYDPSVTPLTGNTLVDSLDGAAIGWKAYADGLPSAGYLGGDSGGYIQHHDPWVYFANFRTASSGYRSAHLVDYSDASVGLVADINNGTVPPFIYVQPTNANNGHSGTDTACDGWVNTFVNTLTASSWYTAGNGKIILWWDESNPDTDTAGTGDANPGGGHVMCVVISASLAGQTLTSNLNHYGMLFAIEQLYGLSPLGNSAHTANGDLSPLLTGSSGGPPPPPPPPPGHLPGPDTAIGVTIGVKNQALLQTGITANLQDLGIGWLRFQPDWMNELEVTKGNYNFTNLDTVVTACNAAKINLLLTIKRPPTFWTIQATDPKGVQYPVPSPDGTLLLAQAMTQRYDGNHGHGIIQALELGNEDYDTGSGNGTVFGPLVNTMNKCYPPLKSAYPNLIIGPGCTLKRNPTHIQYYWTGMWANAAGHFDYINTHYYGDDPSDDSTANGLSFPHNLSILQGCNAAAGHANFPIWATEVGFAINTNYGRAATGLVDQATQSNFLKTELDMIKGLNQPAKLFIFTDTFNNVTPTAGVGTSDGMSIYQGIPGQNGFETTAYAMVKAYPKNWGGGSSFTTIIRDLAMRACLTQHGTTSTVNLAMRAGIKAAGTLATLDIPMRANLQDIGAITISDTFIRADQPQWGNASDGENWVQAGGMSDASIVSNEGQVTGSGAGTNTFRLGVQTIADIEATVRAAISAQGDIFGITLRDTGLNNFIRLRQTGTQIQLVQQTPTGGFVVLAQAGYSPAPYVGLGYGSGAYGAGLYGIGPAYRMRFRAISKSLYGKIWQDGTPEPLTWMLTATTTVQGAGQVGLACSLKSTGDTVLFDSFNASNASLSNNQGGIRKDLSMRARLQGAVGTQRKDLAMRAGIVDLSANTIVTTTYAAKRKPLERRFPKS